MSLPEGFSAHSHHRARVPSSSSSPYWTGVESHAKEQYRKSQLISDKDQHMKLIHNDLMELTPGVIRAASPSSLPGLSSPSFGSPNFQLPELDVGRFQFPANFSSNSQESYNNENSTPLGIRKGNSFKNHNRMRSSISSISSDTVMRTKQFLESEPNEDSLIEVRTNPTIGVPTVNGSLESNAEMGPPLNNNIPSSQQPAGTTRNLNLRNRWSSFIPGQTLRRSFYALSEEELLLQSKLQELARSQNAKLFEDSIMLSYDLPNFNGSTASTSPSLTCENTIELGSWSHSPNADSNGLMAKKKPYVFGQPGDGLRRSNSSVETKSASSRATSNIAASAREKPRRVVSMTAQSLLIHPNDSDDGQPQFMDLRDLEPIVNDSTSNSSFDGLVPEGKGKSQQLGENCSRAFQLKGQALSWTMTGDLLKELAMSPYDDRITLMEAFRYVSNLLSTEFREKNTVPGTPTNWANIRVLPSHATLNHIRENLPLYGRAFGRLLWDLILECKDVFIYRALALFACTIVLGETIILVILAIALALADVVILRMYSLWQKVKTPSKIKIKGDISLPADDNVKGDINGKFNQQIEGKSSAVQENNNEQQKSRQKKTKENSR